jgi:hypothetical protein
MHIVIHSNAARHALVALYSFVALNCNFKIDAFQITFLFCMSKTQHMSEIESLGIKSTVRKMRGFCKILFN